MKERVFLTGGLGFIGSHIARELVSKNYAVRIYDNFTSGTLQNISDIKKSVEVVRGDILDKTSLTKAMRGATIVSHHAAQLEITKSIKDPYFDLTSNTVGTLNVLEACIKNQVAKLVNISSACVYGQTDGKPSRETDATNPNWAYGVSKLAAEKYCSIYNELYNLPIVSLRYAIIYGPNEWYGRVMTIFIKRALEGKPLIIFGAGNQTRDFTHVIDVVRANMLVMNLKHNDHVIFNVSTGIPSTIQHLADMVVKESGTQSTVKIDRNVKEGAVSAYINRLRLPNELNHLVLSPRKLNSILKIKSMITFQKGLKEQIAWVRSHPDRWKKMSY